MAVVCLCWLPGTAYLQVLIDDFESGTLSNWTIQKDTAEIESTVIAAGAFSVRMHRPDGADAATLMVHRTLQAASGVFEFQAFADGPVSDINFYFQYLDSDNYYLVSLRPQSTDNPEVVLVRAEGGNETTLDSAPPTFGLNEWIRVRIYRSCAGLIQVYVNDLLVLEAFDQGITAAGTIALGSWAESSYFDEIYFDAVTDEVFISLDTTICSGSFVLVDTIIYNEEGVYRDTIRSAAGCDSIIELTLSIEPHYLVTARDTICADSFYVFGADTLRSAGRYSNTLRSAFACDSIIELTLIVLGGDTTFMQADLCRDSPILFAGDTIVAPGTYYDEIVHGDCRGTIALTVSAAVMPVTLGPDITVCFDETPAIFKQLTGFDSLRWSDGSTAEEFSIARPGLYTVTAFTGTCSSTDSVQVSEDCPPQLSFYVPNAFSPNGDGFNDNFGPEVTHLPATFHMRVFDRWGGLLYETDNPAAQWDGSAKGESLPVGIYLYTVEVDGELRAGDVALIR